MALTLPEINKRKTKQIYWKIYLRKITFNKILPKDNKASGNILGQIIKNVKINQNYI